MLKYLWNTDKIRMYSKLNPTLISNQPYLFGIVKRISMYKK